MTEASCMAVMSLLERLKERARDPVVDQLSDEIRAFCRSEAVPRIGETSNRAWPLAPEA
jgi:hypothetical protein